MRTLALLSFAAVLALAPRAWGQEEPPPPEPRQERLYVNSGVLQGSTRMVAMGGAYAGIAEGTAGFPSNLAALAHRGPQLDRDWDVGVTLSWLDVPLARRRGQDLDNDGEADEAPGSSQLLFGLLLQYKEYGLGTFLRRRTVTYACAAVECGGHDTLSVAVTQSALAGAMAFGQDEFIVSLGIYTALAQLSHGPQEWEYGGTGLSLDLLFRPQERPYRIGIAVRPQVVGAWKAKEGQTPVLAGQTIYSAVVAPATLSLGVSYRFGEGAERYNRLSPAARRQLIVAGVSNVSPEDSPDAPAGNLLISAQVDMISSVESGVALRSVAAFGEPAPVGRAALFQPHIGAEHDSWPGRVRTRLGVFVEPSAFDGETPRPHLTGGFELFLFRYWEDWAVSASFDLAPRYSNVGFSVGFWR